MLNEPGHHGSKSIVLVTFWEPLFTRNILSPPWEFAEREMDLRDLQHPNHWHVVLGHTRTILSRRVFQDFES